MPTKRLAAPSIAYAFCNQQSKQVFVKENKKKTTKKKKKKSKSGKSLRYMDEVFSRLMTFHHLNVATYI